MHGQKRFHDIALCALPRLLRFAVRVHDENVRAAEHEIRQRAFPPRRLLLADVVALQDDAPQTPHHHAIRNGPHPDPPHENHDVVFAQLPARAQPRQRVEDVEDECGVGARQRRIDVIAAGIQALRILPPEADHVPVKLLGQARGAVRDARAKRIDRPDDRDSHAVRKLTTVDAKYAPQVRQSKTSDDDMKQECVQWHSFALIEARCRSASAENHSLPKS